MIREITDEVSWNTYINSFGQVDCYHTYEYHMVTKNIDDSAVLLVYEQKQLLICLPLLIRPIPGTPYFDATSAYGYVGPLAKNVDAGFEQALFMDGLSAYFRTQKIITVFSRLNPFIGAQYPLLQGCGEIKYKGKIVAIDLMPSLEEQRAQYSKRLKTHINKAKRHCTIKKVQTMDDLRTFREIYIENMKRLQADPFYYFPLDYFKGLMEATSFKTEILLAIEKESGLAIAGNIFLLKDGIVQYHLSGTRNDYMHLMPNKMLIDEMRIIAKETGYKVFNLGGGVGGSSEDSLFQFKSSYSKNFIDFKVWQFIVADDVYNELLESYGIDKGTTFFPAYRKK